MVCPWGIVFRAVPPGEAKREKAITTCFCLFARGLRRGLGTPSPPLPARRSLPRIRKGSLRPSQPPPFFCVRAWPLQSIGRICLAQNRRRRYPARRSGCLSVGEDRRWLVSGENERTGEPGHPARIWNGHAPKCGPKRVKGPGRMQDGQHYTTSNPHTHTHTHIHAGALPRTHTDISGPERREKGSKIDRKEGSAYKTRAKISDRLRT